MSTAVDRFSVLRPALRRLVIPQFPPIPDRVKAMRPDLIQPWAEFEGKLEKWRQDFQMVLQRDPSDEIMTQVDSLKASTQTVSQSITSLRTELVAMIQKAAATPDISNVLSRLTTIEQQISALLSRNRFEKVQNTPVMTETFTHLLDPYPKVDVLDLSTNQKVVCDVQFPSAQEVQLNFDESTTYRVVLN